MRSSNLIGAIGGTPLLGLPTFSPQAGIRLFAKLGGNNPTGSVKGRIARAMVEAALDEGTLDHDRTFGDGGRKYLSTRLWTKAYDELQGTVEGKIWW
jgi:cysteine synthase